MKPKAYYNEFDPYCAEWLRNLVAAGEIPAGDVDSRSIVDVQPEDLDGYTQCHFFAGIGGWGRALRLAGWPDDHPIWTGSPPCQPFSVAGKQRGTDDDRHLWPHYFRLIRARHPSLVVGEEVAAAIGKNWLDGVSVDLEGEGYACEAAVLPACAVNSPHRRDRLWFVAGRGTVGDRLRAGLEGQWRNGDDAAGRPQPDRSTAEAGGDGDVADPNQHRHDPTHSDAPQSRSNREDNRVLVGGSGQLRDAWRHAGWVVGHDGKARRVPSDESGISVLVDGLPASMDRGSAGQASRKEVIKAMGNAIVPQLGAEVIGALMECLE